MEIIESESLFSILMDMYKHNTNHIILQNSIPKEFVNYAFCGEDIIWYCDDKKWVLKLKNSALFDCLLECTIDGLTPKDKIKLSNTLMTYYGRKKIYHLVKETNIIKRFYKLRVFR